MALGDRDPAMADRPVTEVEAEHTASIDSDESVSAENLPFIPLALGDSDRGDGVTQAQSGTETASIVDATNESVPPTQGQYALDEVQPIESTVTLAETTASMEVDLDPTLPRWSEHEDEDERLLLPQPETFQGRSTKTGYVYDVRMRHHNNVHGDEDHPEDPRRIWRIFDAINTAQCTDRMIKIPSREATVEELHLVHTETHVGNITKTTDMSKDDLLRMANSYNSIYLNNMSAFCARLSCGSLIELCKAVAQGQVLNGLAIIRPPGHHAEPDEAGGFCLYNNVAIAARYLQKTHELQKIFILDWDVHHGNGTQTAFYDDPNVVYCSIHRFDHGTFYPGDPTAAAHTAIGEGPGRGRTINIPWNISGMGDSEYIYAFNKVIMPILHEFAPDFILVSAGFDAAEGDHIGQMLVTPAAYGHMTHMLKSLAGGKIILALEGGYNLDSIAVSGLACARALLNDPIEPLGPIIPNALCVQTIHEVIEVQSRYWKSLPQLYTDQTEEPVEGQMTVGMSEILSVYRETYLRERHGMIKMPKLEGEHGTEFLDNVHCTGESCARTLGTNNTVRADKSVLVDTGSHYIDHIVESGNELIDVVVPFQPISEDEKVGLKDRLSALLAEIWDNYVSATGYTGRRIILLAAGFGCHGLVAFMNERQKEVVKYVCCVTMVPGDDSLPMVTKKLGPWYLENSFVVLADDHPVWERAQKINNRIGNLIRSEQSMGRLSELLNCVRQGIFEDIDSKLESLPPAEDDDSDSDFKDDLKPMETDITPIQAQDGNLSEAKVAGTVLEGLQSLPQPQIRQQPPSPVLSSRNDGSRSLQTPSDSGSTLQNGSALQRPTVHLLVDRPTVVGQQHRPQPYPTPNGRSQNGSAPTASPVSSMMYSRSSTPQGRGSDTKMSVEVQESKLRSMASSHPPYPPQHQQAYLEEQRHMDLQRQQQGHYPPHLPRQQGRQEGHPYTCQGGEKRMARVAGSGEYYPTPSTATNSAAASPSTRTPPHSYPTNGSPHPPHSSLKSIPRQYPSSQMQPQHHPSGYGTSQGNNNYRASPSTTAAAASSPVPPFEPMHHHRASYSLQGPPPAPSSNGHRQHSGSSHQQQHPLPTNRVKRSESDPDPYSQLSHSQPRHQQQEVGRPRMEVGRPRMEVGRPRMEVDRDRWDVDRQRWEMEQQARHQKPHPRMDRGGYEMSGPQLHQQHPHQQHYEQMQEHNRSLPVMMKQAQHFQNQHPH
ncbi:Histone deacetylase hda1 [Dissophora ornata]|nr:Histone deacetylase hda1 [Dissophora ornata]